MGYRNVWTRSSPSEFLETQVYNPMSSHTNDLILRAPSRRICIFSLLSIFSPKGSYQESCGLGLPTDWQGSTTSLPVNENYYWREFIEEHDDCLPRISIKLLIHKVILGTWWTPRNSVAKRVVKFLSFFLAITSLVLAVVYWDPLSARQIKVPWWMGSAWLITSLVFTFAMPLAGLSLMVFVS